LSVISTDIRKNIAIVTIDSPPVNALSNAVRSGLCDALKEASNNHDVQAIIMICVGRTFCAGADISEFGKPPIEPTLPDLMDVMDGVSKPLVAAMHGTALGGGFEVALCCHYRIMDINAKVGLPEVNLGLIPGAGGTQRLPRLIGPEAALDMICGGKPITAQKALKIGIADHVCEGSLLESATEFTHNLLRDKKPVRRISDLACEVENEIFETYKTKSEPKFRGFLAPFAAIDAVKAATELSFEEGLKFEREKFMELVSSSQSKAQRHLFFAERAASKVPGVDKNIGSRAVENVAVIGGGIMGCGIAINFLNAGIPVILLEISTEAGVHAKKKIEDIYASSVAKGRVSEEQMAHAIDLLKISDRYDDLLAADLVIEAVYEDMDIKKQVFEKLDQYAKPGAILATNTSFLDIDDIATATNRKEDVIGLHFFSPAHIMPLLEIIRTSDTEDEVIATAFELSKKIRKTAVLSGVCYGFIANRMSSCYGREAGLLLLEGATIEQVDRVMYDFGMPMGMFSMLDMAGIDIGVMAREKLDKEAYDERAFSVHAALVAEGHKGQKTGAGFYRYVDGKEPNPHAEELAHEMAAKYGITRLEISDQEIENRCVLALVNEGCKILEEGIAMKESDIDVVYALGFGFPRYKGGPMHFARHIGLKNCLEKIEEFAQKHGEKWWSPSALLVKLADEE
jgi:3-hydroxyacyl-CoA dehydrogenase